MPKFNPQSFYWMRYASETGTRVNVEEFKHTFVKGELFGVKELNKTHDGFITALYPKAMLRIPIALSDKLIAKSKEYKGKIPSFGAVVDTPKRREKRSTETNKVDIKVEAKPKVQPPSTVLIKVPAKKPLHERLSDIDEPEHLSLHDVRDVWSYFSESSNEHFSIFALLAKEAKGRGFYILKNNNEYSVNFGDDKIRKVAVKHESHVFTYTIDVTDVPMSMKKTFIRFVRDTCNQFNLSIMEVDTIKDNKETSLIIRHTIR